MQYIAARLLPLLSMPGVSGYLQRLREAVELALPLNARVRADSMGNIVLGTGSPHPLIVAPLDEGGLVVSAITPDGYRRAYRHTAAPGPRLATQYLIGQPVEIRTASERIVPGVTATPSTHLRAFRDAQDDARIGISTICGSMRAPNRRRRSRRRVCTGSTQGRCANGRLRSHNFPRARWGLARSQNQIGPCGGGGGPAGLQPRHYQTPRIGRGPPAAGLQPRREPVVAGLQPRPHPVVVPTPAGTVDLEALVDLIVTLSLDD